MTIEVKVSGHTGNGSKIERTIVDFIKEMLNTAEYEGYSLNLQTVYIDFTDANGSHAGIKGKKEDGVGRISVSRKSVSRAFKKGFLEYSGVLNFMSDEFYEYFHNSYSESGKYGIRFLICHEVAHMLQFQHADPRRERLNEKYESVSSAHNGVFLKEYEKLLRDNGISVLSRHIEYHKYNDTPIESANSELTALFA